MKKANTVKSFTITKYLKKYADWITLYIGLFIISTICSILTPIFVANAIEDITMASYSSAIYTFLILMAIALLDYCIVIFLNYIYNRYGMRMIGDMSLDCVAQSFKISSMSYSNHSSGQFMQRIVNDPNRIIQDLMSIINYISSLTSTFVIIIYVVILNWIIGLCVVGLIVVSIIIDLIRLKIFSKNEKNAFSSEDELVAIVNETIKSEKDIKTSGLEKRLNDILNTKTNKYVGANYKLRNTNQTIRQLKNIFQELAIFAILILGVVLMEKSLVTIAVFMVIYSYRGSIKSFSTYFGNFGETITSIKTSLGRIRELFENNEYVIEKFGNVHLENVRGEIEFKDVTFKYKDYEFKKVDNEITKTLKSEILVLKNLNFFIKPNTTVAFVGKSGSGKTTVLSLISKMLEADSGQVLIDGTDIKDLDKETLRKSISLVNQFPYIFDMSIKENLLLAKENATDDEIEKAVKDSYLKDFIDTLPNGIDTVVGESGIKLSGGQRQRLAIARALLRQTSIIIFDESTSSLDNFAQEHIKKCIDNLKGKSTIVIVAHRLSTIKNVDNIFFLENGKIVDEGSFDTLYKNNKKFKNMFTVENLQDELN